MHLAMGQVPIVLGNVKKNLRIMEESLKKAISKSENKIDLIAFPELFITPKILERVNTNFLAYPIIIKENKYFDRKKLQIYFKILEHLLI